MMATRCAEQDKKHFHKARALSGGLLCLLSVFFGGCQATVVERYPADPYPEVVVREPGPVLVYDPIYVHRFHHHW